MYVKKQVLLHISTVFAFLRTKKPGTSYLKPAFSRQLVAVGAYRKRPAGGCAGAGTHLYRAADREKSPIGLAPSPCPAPLAGRRRGCPGPVLAGFTRIYTYAESGCWNVPRKAGKRAAQEAALEEIGQVRSRLRCRSAEGHTRIK